jgi:hypothetical protein
MVTQFCPYCGRDKAPTEFTDEHPIPRSLGGNLTPSNPFLIRVCASCNAACGRWIDGPFVKSWLMHNARAITVDRLYRDSPPQVFPLVYMGPDENWSGDDGTICDFWLGPTGDHIYHFHQPYGSDVSIFAGRPPHLKADDLDPGRVFLAFVAPNPVWHQLVYTSVRAAFEIRTPIHFVNAAPAGQTPPYPPVPAAAEAQIRWITSIPPGTERSLKFSMDMDFGDRFLTKLSLGLGVARFGESFAKSEFASRLRGALWERDPDSRGRFEVGGTSFLGSSREPDDQLFVTEKLHVISVARVDYGIALSVVLYGRHNAFVQLYNDSLAFPDAMGPEGLTWVIHPPTGEFVGPLTTYEFVASKLGYSDIVRDRIAALTAKGKPLPPREIGSV